VTALANVSRRFLIAGLLTVAVIVVTVVFAACGGGGGIDPGAMKSYLLSQGLAVGNIDSIDCTDVGENGSGASLQDCQVNYTDIGDSSPESVEVQVANGDQFQEQY
jgi:hypothetical protein